VDYDSQGATNLELLSYVRTLTGMVLSTLASCVLLATLTSPGTLDEWGPPLKEHWSANRTFVLRVDDKAKTLALKRDTGNGFAMEWTIGFPQEYREGRPAAPHLALVSNDGKDVVLCNVHASMGYGKVLVFLGANGAVTKTYELAEFLSEDEARHALRSISSIWWHAHELVFFDDSIRQFQLVTAAGTVMAFNAMNGEKAQLGGGAAQAIRDKGIAIARDMVATNDPSKQERGKWLLQLLGASKPMPGARSRA
jgi:hypothetical protein